MLDAAQKPNVVYIMADELGYYELSCMGNPNIQTPRIDAMAAEGIRFTQASGRLFGVRPDAMLFDDGQAQRAYFGTKQRRRNTAAAGEATIASMLKHAVTPPAVSANGAVVAVDRPASPKSTASIVFFGYYDQVHAHTLLSALLCSQQRGGSARPATTG